MGSIDDRVNVGVGVACTSVDGLVLLGKRLSDKHGHGTYSFPGGKPDPGESPQEAASRELLEETGLCVMPEELHRLPIWTYDRWEEHGVHYVTLYFHVDIPISQVPTNMEPEKCEDWLWFDPWQPPSPLFEGVSRVLPYVR